jgi:hypothetical protein
MEARPQQAQPRAARHHPVQLIKVAQHESDVRSQSADEPPGNLARNKAEQHRPEQPTGEREQMRYPVISQCQSESGENR